MSMEIKNPQLVSELPLSVSAQRDSQKPPDTRRNQDKAAQDEVSQRAALQAQVEQLNAQTQALNTQLQASSLKFEVSTELNTTVIKVVDTAENKVIRQIPSEEALARLKEIQSYLEKNVYTDPQAVGADGRLKEAISGILINQRL